MAHSAYSSRCYCYQISLQCQRQVVRPTVHRTVNECELCTSQGLERCRSLFYIDVWQYVRINVQKKSLAMQARDRKYYGGKID